MDIVSNIIKFLFGSKADKDRKAIEPYVNKIKEIYPSISALSNDELRARSQALMKRIADFIAPDEERITTLKAQLEKPETELSEKEKISKEIDEITKRIGRMKADLLGINLVAQIQYAYGAYTRDEALRERAIALLEAIPVMGCYCDMIGVRSFAGLTDREYDYAETVLNQFIKYSGRPVFAMETATVHPLQAFADLITIEEHKTKARPKVVLSWAPHCRALPQAVPNSFAQWMNAADVDFVVTHPEGYELDPKFVGNARVEYDQMKALEGADFVYAKNWSCPGVTNPADYGKILSKDMSWTIDEAHMAVTDNGKFMHCLPVRRGLIVTDDVIEGPNSLVIPEAANREISASVVIKRMLEAL